MLFKISTRKKDGGIQAIISYRLENDRKWKTKSKQGFEKERDAKKWANDYVLELQEITKNQDLDPATMDMTFKDAIDMFLHFKKNRIKPNTYLVYVYFFNSLKKYYDLNIKDMSVLNLQKIVDEVNPSYSKYLRAFFLYLKKMKVNTNGADVIFKNHTKVKESIVITIEQYHQFLATLQNEQIIAFCKVAWATGMRASEILGLAPDCVFPDKIIVNKQWNRIDGSNFGFTTLKNGKAGERIIPINKELYDCLHSLPFNFKDKRFFQIRDATSLFHYFKNVDFTAHDFRHTKASVMVQANFNLKYVAYILGDTLETVISTYVSLNDDILEQENKKFSAVFLSKYV